MEPSPWERRPKAYAQQEPAHQERHAEPYVIVENDDRAADGQGQLRAQVEGQWACDAPFREESQADLCTRGALRHPGFCTLGFRAEEAHVGLAPGM